jgi:hypothetical protein
MTISVESEERVERCDSLPPCWWFLAVLINEIKVRLGAVLPGSEPNIYGHDN